ncbi:MAG: imidazolonepropionase [Bacteroidales bacterium]|nr:imidazolonepropionase [Bacteroidales bacterium]MDD4669586.1 imidazolonepropionase [Bacteroidales bacterium]
MAILIKNIKKLVQVEAENPNLRRGKEMSVLNCIDNAYLLIDWGKIADYGEMSELLYMADTGVTRLEELEKIVDNVIDATGKMVFPSFCDSHTHLVYAGSREIEFMDKIRGLSYQEIARRGGGILNSAKLLHETSENELFRQAMTRVDEIIRFGTGAVEIKSGYGLNPEDEIKMLRVIRRISQESPLTVVPTFLGAHAFPEKYKNDHEGYVSEIINEMIPVVASEGLADYIDVFCENGFFSVEDTDRILNAGMKYGLRATVHANQMSESGGVEVGVKYNAISVSHLEFTSDKQYKCLAESQTIANLLPGATFFLEMEYPSARRMLDEYQVAVALATNYNPGSCPCGDMKFITSLACLKMKMTPEEVFNAVTINGAYAMGLGESHGSITRGKCANVFITKDIPSYEFIPYSFSTPLIDTVILQGEIYE